MDMTGFLGKKVDIICVDGQKLSGYVFDVLDSEDSDIGSDCIDLAQIDEECVIEVPIDEISDVSVDTRYKEFDFKK